MSLHVTRDYVAACCSALQRVAVRCSVLQCVVTCCSVLQDLRDKSDDNRSVVIFRNKKWAYHWSWQTMKWWDPPSPPPYLLHDWVMSGIWLIHESFIYVTSLIHTWHDSFMGDRARSYLWRPQLSATHCNTLQHTATNYNTLYHTTTHCTTLPHTAPHYPTLQHNATHCNTLQHIYVSPATKQAPWPQQQSGHPQKEAGKAPNYYPE